CDNLIFHRRAALDQLGQRLLDANRTIGQPNKITVIFGRKVTKQYKGKLQTVIEDLDLPNPVIRSHYGNGFIKQYVRDHLLLRTEPATNNVNDYGVKRYSDYQVEYSRNLIFACGRDMDQVFQALIDRSRVLLDLRAVKTILGHQRLPKFTRLKKNF